MADIMRKNPRKLNMPFLNDVGKAAMGAGGLFLANKLAIPPLMKSEQSQLLIPALVLGETLLGAWIGQKQPWLGASIAGASLGALISAGVATIAEDPSMVALNPEQERQIKDAMSYSGFNENLLLASAAY